MIDFLRGKLAYKEADYVVVDVHGVGYQLFCANPQVITQEDDSDILLYTYHHVREDAQVLFGFQTRAEQALFRKLLLVNGVGPRAALGILSYGRPETIVSAVHQEDVDFLVRLPGVGRKTAQRIILDLKDKLTDLPMNPMETSLLDSSQKPVLSSANQKATVWQEAKMALIALGFSETETDRLWPSLQESIHDGVNAEKLVKVALTKLYKG